MTSSVLANFQLHPQASGLPASLRPLFALFRSFSGICTLEKTPSQDPHSPPTPGKVGGCRLSCGKTEAPRLQGLSHESEAVSPL
jgi:hypothetical protein